LKRRGRRPGLLVRRQQLQVLMDAICGSAASTGAKWALLLLLLLLLLPLFAAASGGARGPAALAALPSRGRRPFSV
jgi:hypothetical protein